MPLMKLDASPRSQHRYWHFGVLSLALHALLLGLGGIYLCPESEIRFFSPDNAVSVSLIASGVPHGKGETEEDTEHREKVTPAKEEKNSPPVPLRAPEVKQKKRSTPQKAKVTPKTEPSEAQSLPSENKAGLENDSLSPHLGAAGERTIGDGDAPSYARFVPPEYPR
jgi:hypothetical protein